MPATSSPPLQKVQYARAEARADSAGAAALARVLHGALHRFVRGHEVAAVHLLHVDVGRALMPDRVGHHLAIG